VYQTANNAQQSGFQVTPNAPPDCWYQSGGAFGVKRYGSDMEIRDSIQLVSFKIRGLAPLMMHSAALANPRFSITKELKLRTSKRQKTDEDLQMIADLEWCGGLYVTEGLQLEISGNSLNIISGGQPCIPAVVLEGCLQSGAKKDKNGLLFKAGVFVDSDAVLEYPRLTNGADNAAELNALIRSTQHFDYRSAGVQSSRIMRSRPIFPEWGATVNVAFMPDVVTQAQVKEALIKGGIYAAVGDYRPRYGRFEVL